jgi:hypothetical protein
MAKECKVEADCMIQTAQRQMSSSSVVDASGQIQMTKHIGKRSEVGSVNALAPKAHLRSTKPPADTRSAMKQHRDWKD